PHLTERYKAHPKSWLLTHFFQSPILTLYSLWVSRVLESICFNLLLGFHRQPNNTPPWLYRDPAGAFILYVLIKSEAFLLTVCYSLLSFHVCSAANSLTAGGDRTQEKRIAGIS